MSAYIPPQPGQLVKVSWIGTVHSAGHHHIHFAGYNVKNLTWGNSHTPPMVEVLNEGEYVPKDGDVAFVRSVSGKTNITIRYEQDGWFDKAGNEILDPEKRLGFRLVIRDNELVQES